MSIFDWVLVGILGVVVIGVGILWALAKMMSDIGDSVD